MQKFSKHKTITLGVFHLPILIALLAIAGVSAGTLALKDRGQNLKAKSAVLSEEDTKDSEDTNKNEDAKDSEDSNTQESDSQKDSEDSEDSNVEHTANTGNRVTSSGRGIENSGKIEDRESDSEEVKDPEEEKAHDELEKSEEMAEVSSVVNADGTVTKTFKKIDGDEIETKIVTYDANGKVIDTEELNEDGSEDTEKTVLISTVTNADGTVTKTFQKTEDGKVELTALTYDKDGNLIKKAKLNADGTVKEEELVGEHEEDSGKSEDKFKLVFKPGLDGAVDPALSGIIKAKLEQEIETEGALGTSVNKVELEIKTAKGTIKYEGTALKDEKLFGLFGIEIPVDLVVDPITGKIISVNQSFWSKILDFFSI
jgi:hypothetical protein